MPSGTLIAPPPKQAEQTQIDYIRMLRSELGEDAANDDVLDMTKQEAHFLIDYLVAKRKRVLNHHLSSHLH